MALLVSMGHLFSSAYLRLADDGVGGQLFQIVLQGGAAALHKIGARALPLHRVFLRPRGDEVAPVRGLQQIPQRLQCRETEEGLQSDKDDTCAVLLLRISELLCLSTRGI